jgi:chaperonin GroEL (HSP60 family)
LTEAQLKLAYELVSELSMYARAIDQYGNQRIAAAMRNAASLLSQMIAENEGKRQENNDVFPGFRGNNES